jgi:polyhydroxyalkanoate synthesis repressor PhaR
MIMTQRVIYELRMGGKMSRKIRRYENRKLYDTERKRYVSLTDLAELIREGEEIQVVESPSGEDVTARTLTSIIVEAEREGQEPFSSGFLHDVIRWGGKVVTVTVDQVEQQFDRVVRASLERLKPVRETREEMKKLLERVGELEARIDALSRPRTPHAEGPSKENQEVQS